MRILEELYNGNIAEIQRKLPQEKKDLELDLYEQLKEKLDKDNLSLFFKYCEVVGERNSMALQDTYIQGLKTGILIGIECKDIDL